VSNKQRRTTGSGLTDVVGIKVAFFTLRSIEPRLLRQTPTWHQKEECAPQGLGPPAASRWSAQGYHLGAGPVQQVLLQVLQERCREEQDGFDDLRRGPDRHRCRSDGASHNVDPSHFRIVSLRFGRARTAQGGGPYPALVMH
jgi:hypothetical protein